MNLICGINPVLEALAAGTRHFDRLLIAKGLRSRRISEAISRASQNGIPLRFEARETLDRMAGGIPHQGIIAVVSAKPVIGLETLLEEARDPALLVVLDGVEDPRNLGAILRSVEAAGADGVLLPERHSAGLSEAVARASAGALEHVRVARIGNVVQALETLKARGLWVVGFDAAGTERWDGVDYRRPIALVLGGEGRGIRRLVRERCDHLVSLPLFGHVGSLNVSVAAGIALYEVVRQRGSVPSNVRPIPLRSAPARAQIVVGPGPEDAEHDPGAARVGGGESLPDDEEEIAEAPSSVVRIHDEDELAWSGPTVLKAVGHRGRRGGERSHAGRGTPVRAYGGGGTPQPGEPAEGRGRGRRRRHRGAGVGAPQGAEGPGRPREFTPPDGVPVAGGGPPPPGGRPRRRRRRRRR